MNKAAVGSLASILVAFTLLISSCEDDSPAGGFTVTTSEAIEDPIFGTGITIDSPVSGIQVIGNYASSISGGTPEGSLLHFAQYSVGGSLFVSGGKNPAWWTLAEANGPCGGQSVYDAIIQPQRLAQLICLETTLKRGSISPDSFDGNFSPTITLTTNDPMDLSYGAPKLTVASATGDVYYDQTPDYYDDTTLVLNQGALPALYDDIYYVIASSQLPDGSYGSAAVATISTYGNPYGDGGDPCQNWCLCNPCEAMTVAGGLSGRQGVTLPGKLLPRRDAALRIKSLSDKVQSSRFTGISISRNARLATNQRPACSLASAYAQPLANR